MPYCHSHSALPQLKRNRDKLRPYLVELEILPDPSRKDKMAVGMPQLQVCFLTVCVTPADGARVRRVFSALAAAKMRSLRFCRVPLGSPRPGPCTAQTGTYTHFALRAHLRPRAPPYSRRAGRHMT